MIRQGLRGVLRLITVACLAAWATSGEAKQACDAGAPFRAMTYNIRLDTAADGANDWAHRRPLFLSQLALLRPQVLGLQEVLPGQRRDLDAALPGYLSLGGGRDDGKAAGEASPLYVDGQAFAVRGSGMFWLSPTPDRPSLGWDAGYRRVVTWAHLVSRRGALRLLAVNTHWDNTGQVARRESAKQLRGWIAANRRKGEHVLVIGDFNAPLAEASLADMTTGSLRDSRSASAEPPAGAGFTFNGFDPLARSGQTIDHILVGPGLQVLRHHVLAEQFDGRLASDHFPVIADLSRDCR